MSFCVPREARKLQRNNRQNVVAENSLESLRTGYKKRHSKVSFVSPERLELSTH